MPSLADYQKSIEKIQEIADRHGLHVIEPYRVYNGIPAKRLKDRNKRLFELEKEFEQDV